ncbi:MAG: hypothetical protein NXI04_28340 [Planctomycetaceae bacterium]|nr:hypothetical protein [Planctomycetaceae bacterium]
MKNPFPMPSGWSHYGLVHRWGKALMICRYCDSEKYLHIDRQHRHWLLRLLRLRRVKCLRCGQQRVVPARRATALDR